GQGGDALTAGGVPNTECLGSGESRQQLAVRRKQQEIGGGAKPAAAVGPQAGDRDPVPHFAAWHFIKRELYFPAIWIAVAYDQELGVGRKPKGNPTGHDGFQWAKLLLFLGGKEGWHTPCPRLPHRPALDRVQALFRRQ